jgi:hypothetical protein
MPKLLVCRELDDGTLGLTETRADLAPRQHKRPDGKRKEMANVSGSSANDFIHRIGDGRTVPSGFNEITGVTEDADNIDGKEGNDQCISIGRCTCAYFRRRCGRCCL